MRDHNSQQRLLKSMLVFAQRDGINPELSISGSHLLVALTMALGLVGPVAWAFLRYWLFAP